MRPASPAADNYAGSEIDVLASYLVSKNFTLTAGYTHFFAGTYLSDTGASSDADFLYVMSGIKF